MELNEPLAPTAPEIVGGDVVPPIEINRIPVELINRTITVGSNEDLAIQALQNEKKKKKQDVPDGSLTEIFAPTLPIVSIGPAAKLAKVAIMKELKTAVKPPKVLKVQDRTGYTIHFYGEEQQYLKNIFEARKEVGASADFTHFLRQAIDFAINFNSQLPQLEKKVKFSVPEQPVILLKNGFYDQE